jgi:hypothetical protein
LSVNTWAHIWKHKITHWKLPEWHLGHSSVSRLDDGISAVALDLSVYAISLIKIEHLGLVGIVDP